MAHIENILSYIPENTFIDKRKYSSYEDLYLYISTMKQYEYEKYIDNIANFLTDVNTLRFSNNHFARTIVDRVVCDL